MSTIDAAKRKYNNESDSANPIGRHIVDADCEHEAGKFVLKSLSANLPGLFTVRFTAPADYVQNDVIVAGGKELPVRTPGMVSAASNIFRAGAVIHCDIDLDRELAFFWQGGGNGTGVGVLPNLSYDEQFAGFYDVDGSKVYVKTVEFGRLTNNYSPLTGNSKRMPHGIGNINNLIDFRARFMNDNNRYIIMNCTMQSTSSGYCRAAVDKNDIIVANNFMDMSKFVMRITIYYTCTDR